MLKNIVLIMILCITSNWLIAEELSLIDQKWILHTLDKQKIDLSAYGEQKPNIEFKADNRYYAYAGCNRIVGSFKLGQDKEISFLPNAIMTKMACMNPNNIEDKFVNILSAVKFWEIKEQDLIFSDKTNKIVMVFAK